MFAIMSAKIVTVIVLLMTVMNVVKGSRISNETGVSCSDVRRVFVMKGIGSSQIVPDTRTKGEDLAICPSAESCCSKPMEDSYKEQVKKDFRNMLQSSGSYLKTLITTSATKFKDTFLDMVQVSENSTTALFSDVYQLIESTAREPLNKLFADLLAFVSGQDVDLEDRVHAFFDSLFPLAFHHSVHNSKQKKEFTDQYKECLSHVQQEVRPFGDLPETIVLQVAKSFEAARTFLEALQVGVEVLNTTEHMDFGPDCRAALVKLNYCPHCRGILETRPCAGLCLNVVRGCLSSVSEMDSAWSEYVSALERLTSGMVGIYNIEQVLSTLDTKISETIMYVMENTPEITKRVKQKCGYLRRVTREANANISSSPPPPKMDAPPRPAIHPRSSGSETSLYIQLQNFVHKVAESKDFYSNLADSLCNDGNLGVQGDHRCWNGEGIGDYSKTIAGVGVTAQKYNPEMRPPRVRDMAVSTLVEKLQHVRQVLTSRVTSVPQSDSSVIAEGSGSGSWYRSGSDDEDYADGSGSGDYGAKEDKTDLHFEPGDSSPKGKDTSVAAHHSRPSTVAMIFAVVSAFLFFYAPTHCCH